MLSLADSTVVKVTISNSCIYKFLKSDGLLFKFSLVLVYMIKISLKGQAIFHLERNDYIFRISKTALVHYKEK